MPDDNSCARCGAVLLADDSFCTKCGTAATSAARTAGGSPGATSGLQWKWVFIGAAVMVGTQLIFGVVYGLALRASGGGGVNRLVVGLLGLLGCPVGGFIVALLSPGLTIREPALGAVFAIGFFTLLHGVPQGLLPSLVSLAVIYGLTIVGAKLGEALQRRRG